MNGQPEDSILLRAAQAGDVDAFEQLVRRYQTSIYKVALRMLGSQADAQDVVQETFVRAWRALPRFRHDSAVRTWLYRIVTRQALDKIASRRTTGTLDRLETDAGPDPAQTAEHQEQLRAVRQAIADLPPEQRAALVLREFAGLSYREVAQVLGASVPAIKTRIHRARLTVIQQTSSWQ